MVARRCYPPDLYCSAVSIEKEFNRFSDVNRKTSIVHGPTTRLGFNCSSMDKLATSLRQPQHQCNQAEKVQRFLYEEAGKHSGRVCFSVSESKVFVSSTGSPCYIATAEGGPFLNPSILRLKRLSQTLNTCRMVIGYHEADMRTGRATYWQLTSLQAFWPGLQILVGDVAAANASHREFYHVWKRFGLLPERYLLDRNALHPTEKYYPLRPELAESTFYLYQATKDPWYMEVGESIISSLNRYAKVTGGFASIRDVTTMQKEDHQHSFFLSETCKYLYLLYDDTFLAGQNYIFTTEGHPLPIRSSWHEKLPAYYIPRNWTRVKSEDDVLPLSSMSQQVCPVTFLENNGRQIESACHIHDNRADHRCRSDDECGIDSTTCRRRTCSLAGYCGLWVFID